MLRTTALYYYFISQTIMQLSPRFVLTWIKDFVYEIKCVISSMIRRVRSHLRVLLVVQFKMNIDGRNSGDKRKSCVVSSWPEQEKFRLGHVPLRRPLQPEVIVRSGIVKQCSGNGLAIRVYYLINNVHKGQLIKRLVFRPARICCGVRGVLKPVHHDILKNRRRSDPGDGTRNAGVHVDKTDRPLHDLVLDKRSDKFVFQFVFQNLNPKKKIKTFTDIMNCLVLIILTLQSLMFSLRSNTLFS